MADDGFDLEHFMPYLLNQAAEAASRGFSEVYKRRYGILRTDWRVLFHLGLYGPLTAREISDRASVHKAKISRAVARLEARRLLARRADTGDRRREILQLTAQGRQTYDELHAVARRYDAEVLSGLTSDEIALLRRLLRQLASRPRSGP